MGIPVLPRSLLASAAALTLGHAVFAQETQCNPHHGNLVVHEVSWGSFEPSDRAIGYVRPTGPGTLFTIEYSSVTGDGSPASFYFWGCKGGPEFSLYCNDPACDPSGEAVVEIYGGSVDANGDPNNWTVANTGVNPIWFPQGTYNDIVYSSYWTWGIDDLIRPVTFNFDGSNQGLLLDAQLAANGALVYVLPSLDDGDLAYHLTWEGS